jgi:capsular polysaccharide export protein
VTDALLPPPLAHWPAIALRGDAPAAAESESGYGAIAALARIRAERLFWPAPRSGAARPRALALDAAGLAAARAAHDDRDIAQGSDLAGIDPERLERIYGAGGPAMLWARIGGLAPDPDDATVALLATARCVSPWTGAPIGLDEAVEAQALLRGAAMAARGPATLIGMSAWKRRCLRPFFIGPDGPPTHVRTAARAATGRPSVVWGAQDADGALRVEDGFLRSVGLGLRHTPPVSLVIDARPPHFDATQPNGFEALVAETAFTPALRERARQARPHGSSTSA